MKEAKQLLENGNGLAFFISQKIVEQYEGSLELKSNMDIGLSLQMNFKCLSETDFIDLPDNMRSSKSFMQLKDLMKSKGSFSSQIDSHDYVNKSSGKKSRPMRFGRSKSMQKIPAKRKP